MYQCMFSAHCIEKQCDKSCPQFVESSYLLERNNIAITSDVFNTNKKYIERSVRTIEECKGLSVVVSNNTTKTAELLTYCGICKSWKGSQLHCTVYNLKYSKYIEEIKKSWSTHKEPDELEYMRIWSESCKVLIISNLDFMTLGDFECQTLLTLIQSREYLSTIIVAPQLSSLVGKGPFFDRLIAFLSKAVVK